jgi:P-type Ca2+ transporter type 2C
MKWQNLSVDEVLKNVKSDENGLNTKQVIERVLKYGKNELVEEEKPGPIKRFLGQFKDFLIMLLIVAALAAAAIGDTTDAAVIMVVVVLNAVVGFMQENRAENAMEKLKGMTSTQAIVLRDGKKQEVPANELTIGDVVVVEEGDKVPADLRLIKSYDLLVDESPLTGESKPFRKNENVCEGDETRNLVFMDTNVSTGRGKGVVVEVGMNTRIGKIAEMIQVEEAKTPLQDKIASLGKMLGVIALVVCSGIFLLQLSKNVPIVETFMTAVSLAVAAVPEGLPAILTLTLALGMQRMAKNNAVVRKLLAVETLGSCTTICTDKTGTLTKNKMTVRKTSITDPEMVFKISALCNNATISKEEREIKSGKDNPKKDSSWQTRAIGDPTDVAMLLYAEENGYSREELEKTHKRLFEIPLDSERKRMTTVNEFNGQRYLLIKGAPELVLERCSMIKKGAVEGDAVGKSGAVGENTAVNSVSEGSDLESNASEDGSLFQMEPEDRGRILNDLMGMTVGALRVLALAYRKLEDKEDLEDKEALEKDLIFAGLVGMMDPPRREAKDAVATCKNAGINVVMITGDHKDTAAAIASEIGILNGGTVLTGSDLDRLSDEEFQKVVEDVNVYARVFPEQKVRIVEALKSGGHVVSMTGDGVNDAPALKRAEIGVSMGTGTDVAKESSDMILQDDNFATIVKAVKEGRTIFDNIRRFVKFQLSTNIGAILTITAASISNMPIPFNPIQILWINMIMDGPPAQSLGVEPADPDVMERPPSREQIISRRNLLKIIITGVVMSVGTLALYYFELSSGVSTIKATTMAFTVFVMFQIFNVFNCKSRNSFSNKVLMVAVAASFLLQVCVIYVPFLQGIFRTTAISAGDWVLVAVVAAIIFVSEFVSNRLIK